jgi:hypothetical protein
MWQTWGGEIVAPSNHALATAVAEHPLRFLHRAVAQYEFLDDGTIMARYRLDITTPPVRVLPPPLPLVGAQQQRARLCPLPVAIVPKFALLSGLTIEDDWGRKLPPLNRYASLELTADLLLHRVRHLAEADGLSIEATWEPVIRAVATLPDRPRGNLGLPAVELASPPLTLTSAKAAYSWLRVHTTLGRSQLILDLLNGAQRDSLLHVVLDDVTQWRRRLITVCYRMQQPDRSRLALGTLSYRVFAGLGLASLYFSQEVATSYADSHHVEITAPSGCVIKEVESIGAWHGVAETSLAAPSMAHIRYPREEFAPGHHPSSDTIVIGLRVPFRGWARVAGLSVLLETILLILVYMSRQRVFDAHAQEWVAASLIALASIPAAYLAATHAGLARWSADQLFLLGWIQRISALVGLAFAWALLLQRPPGSRLYPILAILSLTPIVAYSLYVIARVLEIVWAFKDKRTRERV